MSKLTPKPRVDPPVPGSAWFVLIAGIIGFLAGLAVAPVPDSNLNADPALFGDLGSVGLGTSAPPGESIEALAASLTTNPLFAPSLDELVLDAAQRQLDRHRMSGSKEPLMVVTFHHTQEVRRGDEVPLEIRFRCVNCAEKHVSVSVLAPGMKATPVETGTFAAQGDVDVTRTFLLSADTTGRKSLVISASGKAPGHSASPSISYVDVLPPLGVFNIPEPYVDFILKFLAAAGFSGLLLFGLNHVFKRKMP